jgi:hypothetical protein
VNQIRQQREKEKAGQWRIETYTFVCVSEAKERDMEAYHHPISQHTHDLLMCIGLLKFYEEGRSLRGDSTLLQQLIRQWDHGRQGFMVDLDMWYHPMEKDVYFITGCSRRGVYFPHFECGHKPISLDPPGSRTK